MTAEVEIRDGILFIEGDNFNEECGENLMDLFQENPGENYHVLLDTDDVDLGTEMRKKILNDLIEEGRTKKIAIVDPPLKVKVFLKIVRSTGHEEVETFKNRDEALEYLKGD